MADRWGWQGWGRSTTPYSVFSPTVKMQIQFSSGSIARMAAISLLPPFFFSLFSSWFYSSKEGLARRLIPPPTCLPVSALVWGRGSSVIIFGECMCSGYVNLPCSGLVTQLRPWLWCSPSAEPALCLKCLCNYNVYGACVCCVNHSPHHT